MKEKKIDTSQIMIGMYVSRLDRPWSETPFLLQGVYVHGDMDIKLLQKHCHHVYIDTEKTVEPAIPTDRRKIKNRRSRSERRTPNDLDITEPQVVYSDKTSVDEELEVAKELHGKIFDVVHELIDNAKSGNKIDVSNVKAVIKEMKQSILRNPSAFLLLRLLKDKDTYTYTHCLDMSVLCIVFGRHLGMSQEILDDLAIGTLMCDIGKIRLPSELLNKPGRLTKSEFEVIKEHVKHSVAIMEEAGNLSRTAIEVAATHHERFDGTGYLRGLKGSEIPVLGRMAAIVDCYDAMTSERCYSTGVSPHEAIRRLYAWRNELFQDELVEHFIQAIGAYPTGSIVELSTGQVGIVIMQNRIRRLRPKVMLVLDENKKSLGAGPIIDLMKETEDSKGDPLEIVKAGHHDEYGIDPRDYYL